jgi:hypothetical protein
MCNSWSADIKSRINSSTSEEHRSVLQLKATEVALVCINTFDVEEDHLSQMLSEPLACSTFLQCAIDIQSAHRVLCAGS